MLILCCFLSNQHVCFFSPFRLGLSNLYLICTSRGYIFYPIIDFFPIPKIVCRFVFPFFLNFPLFSFVCHFFLSLYFFFYFLPFLNLFFIVFLLFPSFPLFLLCLKGEQVFPFFLLILSPLQPTGFCEFGKIYSPVASRVFMFLGILSSVADPVYFFRIRNRIWVTQ